MIKKYLIPHHSNNYHPHVVRPPWLIALTLIALSALVLATYHATELKNDDLGAAVIAQLVVDGTNETRSTHDAKPLAVHPLLEKAAQAKADDMVARGYFAHYAPDGTSPWSFIHASGYQFINAGENLAVNFSTSDAVVHAWLNSPTHRSNLLNTTYTEIGIGIAEGEYKGKKATFVVQMLGTPIARPQPESRIALEPQTVSTDVMEDTTVLPSEVSSVQDENVSEETVVEIETATTAVVLRVDANVPTTSTTSTTTTGIATVGTQVLGATLSSGSLFDIPPHQFLQIVFGIIAALISISLIGIVIARAWHVSHVIAFGLFILCVLFVSYTFFAWYWFPVYL